MALARSTSLVLLLLLITIAAACGPSVSSGDDDDDVTADAGDPDAFVPTADARISVAEMYVHTSDTLYIIDDQNFDLQLIGTFGLGEEEGITDMAVTPDGTLYGISADSLYTLDEDTGAATLEANVPGQTNVGLTFLPDGTLLATDKAGGVRRVDPESGQVMEVGAFGGGYATAGDLVAVADGTMYAISDEGPEGDEFDNNWLLTVDTATGVASPVGQIGYGQVFGCAVANNNVYAFTTDGEIIEIDPVSGAGMLRREYPSIVFWGAGVTPLAVIE